MFNGTIFLAEKDEYLIGVLDTEDEEKAAEYISKVAYRQIKFFRYACPVLFYTSAKRAILIVFKSFTVGLSVAFKCLIEDISCILKIAAVLLGSTNRL